MAVDDSDYEMFGKTREIDGARGLEEVLFRVNWQIGRLAHAWSVSTEQ